MKTCTKCKESKDLNCFAKDSSAKGGIYPSCKDCRSKYVKTEKVRERDRARYSKRAEKLKNRLKQQYILNKEPILQRTAKYRDLNRKKHNLCSLNWQKKNRGYVRAKTAEYFLRKKKACPSWITKEQSKEIMGYYLLAKDLQWLSEERLEVDHIIPLKGKNVCGLHVPWNLQILPKSMNVKKRNYVLESAG